MNSAKNIKFPTNLSAPSPKQNTEVTSFFL